MLEILHNYLPLFLIGAYPDGPLGGLAMTLILSVLGLGLSFPIAILIGLALLSSFAWLRFAAQWWTRVIRRHPVAADHFLGLLLRTADRRRRGLRLHYRGVRHRGL